MLAGGRQNEFAKARRSCAAHDENQPRSDRQQQAVVAQARAAQRAQPAVLSVDVAGRAVEPAARHRVGAPAVQLRAQSDTRTRAERPARAAAGLGRQTARSRPAPARMCWARFPARTPRGAQPGTPRCWRCCSSARRRRWPGCGPRSRPSSRRRAARCSRRARCRARGGTAGCTRRRA
jgi:hypothetical protein